MESPDAGPALAPPDVEVERRTADGCREEVRPGTRTGTLFTDLTTARRTLSPGETLTEHYRVTVRVCGPVLFLPRDRKSAFLGIRYRITVSCGILEKNRPNVMAYEVNAGEYPARAR
ncbi:hypothetical protein [Streptomyces sp. NPDC050287]|uniref:hypothetical protein n=1 Tax=Streptomyces sp. NPDC050287 TaxID=3365608 RepID=UPI0037AC3E19